MAVRKQYGWRGCKDVSPIRRKPFVGDPAQVPFEHNPAATTERGKRKRTDHAQHQEYINNREDRSRQSCPADHTRPVHKGPHKRPKGIGTKSFQEMMNKKHEWDC